VHRLRGGISAIGHCAPCSDASDPTD
jgi:hypothetical protein